MNDKDGPKISALADILKGSANLLQSTQAVLVSIPEEILAQDKGAQSPPEIPPETTGPPTPEQSKDGSDTNPPTPTPSPPEGAVSE